MKKLMMIFLMIVFAFVVSCNADGTDGSTVDTGLSPEEQERKDAFLAQVNGKSVGGYFDSPAGLAYMGVDFGDGDEASFKLGVGLDSAEAANALVARDATFSEGVSDNTANYTYVSGSSGNLAEVSFRVDGNKFFMKFGGKAENDGSVTATLLATATEKDGKLVADGAVVGLN